MDEPEYELEPFEIIPPSDEVKQEEERQQHAEERKQELEAMEAEVKVAQEAIEKADTEHLERNRAEHDERIAAARAFDWDKWESETGLVRPEIEG